MSVETKIRELLEGKEQLSEEVLEEKAGSGKVAGDQSSPKQGSSASTPAAGEMGTGTSKDTTISGKVAGDQKQPRQGDSKDAPISSERNDETANPGAKEAAPVSGSNQGTISQKGAGKAPNFSDDEDPRKVVNQSSSKGNVAKEEVEVEDEVIAEEEVVEEEIPTDISSLFEGNEDLSEEFVAKASSLFEAVVTARVNDKVSKIEEELVEESAKLVEDFKEEMSDKIDSYMNYVVEKWLEENQLAVENGLRNDITESFIDGMKNLFAEHYIDVPEEKYDVLGEMQNQIAEMQAKLDEQLSANVELHNNNIELQKEGVFASVAEGLAKTEAEKFKSLVADVEFENAEIFEEKLNVIKENYFPKTSVAISEDKLVDEDVDLLDESTVSKYVEALNKMAKK